MGSNVYYPSILCAWCVEVCDTKLRVIKRVYTSENRIQSSHKPLRKIIHTTLYIFVLMWYYRVPVSRREVGEGKSVIAHFMVHETL